MGKRDPSGRRLGDATVALHRAAAERSLGPARPGGPDLYLRPLGDASP